MNSIAVFCGSQPGTRPIYLEEAKKFGTLLAERGITLVYGGASVGLMGAVADAAISAGGIVIGVLPEGLEKRELAHAGLTELHITRTMHERKQLMADRSDAFVAMPGGIGTLEEIYEQWTWLQLGIHQKPCGLLNVADFYKDFIEQAQILVREGFVGEETAGAMVNADNGPELIHLLETVDIPAPKWHPKP